MDWDNINTILNRTKIETNICDLLLSFDKYYNDINFKKGFYIYGTPGSGKTKFVEKTYLWIVRKPHFCRQSVHFLQQRSCFYRLGMHQFFLNYFRP